MATRRTWCGRGREVALLLSLTPLAAVSQQADTIAGGDARPPVATFSILGYDPATGEIGAAVQSRVFSAGNGVIWGQAGVGVVATQAWVDVSYGPQGLQLLRQGLAPAEIIQRILDDGPDPMPERWPEAGRQFSVMNARGEVAAHTGPKASD